MSKLTASANPASTAAADAARTPPAGPDSKRAAARAVAALFRTDGRVFRIEVGTSGPLHDMWKAACTGP
jgi:hypothetical protein